MYRARRMLSRAVPALGIASLGYNYFQSVINYSNNARPGSYLPAQATHLGLGMNSGVFENPLDDLEFARVGWNKPKEVRSSLVLPSIDVNKLPQLNPFATAQSKQMINEH